MFVAGKYEFLIGNTEMSLSVWDNKNYNPVYGFDVSSRIEDVDVRGEISLARGEDYSFLDYNTLKIIDSDKDWIPRISCGFTKFFDHGDITDRISITGEYYYNGSGYEENMFQRIEDISNTQDKIALKGQYLSFYEPYINSRYYLAFFTAIQKFPVAKTSFNLNTIINLVDKSNVISAGISYNPRTNVYFDININGNFGNKNTEATFSGERFRLALGTKVLF